MIWNEKMHVSNPREEQKNFLGIRLRTLGFVFNQPAKILHRLLKFWIQKNLGPNFSQKFSTTILLTQVSSPPWYCLKIQRNSFGPILGYHVQTWKLSPKKNETICPTCKTQFLGGVEASYQKALKRRTSGTFLAFRPSFWFLSESEHLGHRQQKVWPRVFVGHEGGDTLNPLSPIIGLLWCPSGIVSLPGNSIPWRIRSLFLLGISQLPGGKAEMGGAESHRVSW